MIWGIAKSNKFLLRWYLSVGNRWSRFSLLSSIYPFPLSVHNLILKIVHLRKLLLLLAGEHVIVLVCLVVVDETHGLWIHHQVSIASLADFLSISNLLNSHDAASFGFSVACCILLRLLHRHSCSCIASTSIQITIRTSSSRLTLVRCLWIPLIQIVRILIYRLKPTPLLARSWMLVIQWFFSYVFVRQV